MKKPSEADAIAAAVFYRTRARLDQMVVELIKLSELMMEGAQKIDGGSRIFCAGSASISFLHATALIRSGRDDLARFMRVPVPDEMEDPTERPTEPPPEPVHNGEAPS